MDKRNGFKEPDLHLDRIVFFSDAVVAIAITLLVLDLKLDVPKPRSVQWSDLAALLPKFAAFVLSFVLIALFWIIHNQFFRHIKRMNEPLVWLNVIWLFFIALLPFSTSLLSAHFGEPVSTMVYTINTLGIAAAQNFIWDFVAERPDFLNDTIEKPMIRNYRIYCNVGMINGLVALVFAFFAPVVAFFILFTRPVMIAFYQRWTIRSRMNR